MGSQAAVSLPAVGADESERFASDSKRVLVVGAGGIGCELIKTLVLSGFKRIHLMDMDTIEVSNLNRQFLFRKSHVGQSKAEVARAAAERMAGPGAEIVAHHSNVKAPRYDVDFFGGFDIVLNGLDNLDARRHVNRMTLAAKVPLIESGTTGYSGQVTVHVAGVTECFECQPKPTPKKFPVCTIRNTPDKPIHCIVWAKDLLFPRLFGEEREDAKGPGPAPEASPEGDAAGDGRDIEIGAPREGESGLEYAARVLEEVYGEGIRTLVEIEDMWKDRAPPTPLDAGTVREGLARARDSANASAPPAPSDAHAVLGVADLVLAFLSSSDRLLSACQGGKVLSFDKDFDLSVDFVAAAANLRAHCYGIPIVSRFEAKGMAGNIIHAVATTNAIIAGLIVIEAQKVLMGHGSVSYTSFVRHKPTSGRLIQRIRPDKPNPRCYVCSQATLRLVGVDPTAMTLGELVEAVLRGRLAFAHPTVMLGDSILFESGDDLEPDEVANNAKQAAKTLGSLGIATGVLFGVEDYSQSMKVQILMGAPTQEGGADGKGKGGEKKGTGEEEEEGPFWTIEGEMPAGKEDAKEDTDDDSDSDDIVVCEEPQEKRQRTS